MYASYIEAKVKSGTSAKAIALAKNMISDVGEIPNVKKFILIDKGNDNILLLAFYDTAAEQEAAGPLAKEILGRLEHFYAAPPERIQVEVPINHSYEQGEAIALWFDGAPWR